MSVVVGIESVGGAYMACDAFCGNSDHIDLMGPKVFITPGGIAIGAVGQVRVSQVLQYWLQTTPPDPGADTQAWAVTVLVPALRDLAEEHDLAGEDGEPGGPYSLLVAVNGHIYEINDEYACTRSEWGYVAIGSGAAYAYGALAALCAPDIGDDDRVVCPRWIAESAVRAAARHSTSVELDGDPSMLWVEGAK